MKLKPPTSRPGFTLIEFIIIVAVLAVLAGIYLPAILRPRRHNHAPCCTNNLKQIGLAFRQWALDNNDKIPPQVSVTNGGTMEWIGVGNVFPHFLVMSNELNTPWVLACPHDKAVTVLKSFSTTFSDANISYFVGIDAVDTMPQMFLTGDCNFQKGGKPVSGGVLVLGTNSQAGWTRSRHKGPEGNIALADGSVQSFTSTRLREALVNSGDTTNRLAIP